MHRSTEEPSYFAVIPAVVRYDNVLTDKAKLLYGEITALSNAEGYCYATNGYFARLYNVGKQTISRAIASLEARGHITVVIDKDKATNEVLARRIFPLTPVVKNDSTPIVKKRKDNNTRNNKARNKTGNIPLKAIEGLYEYQLAQKIAGGQE